MKMSSFPPALLELLHCFARQAAADTHRGPFPLSAPSSPWVWCHSLVFVCSWQLSTVLGLLIDKLFSGGNTNWGSCCRQIIVDMRGAEKCELHMFHSRAGRFNLLLKMMWCICLKNWDSTLSKTSFRTKWIKLLCTVFQSGPFKRS